jgi:hypothetical protein
MSFEQFKDAVDSMIGYPKMTGIMGGEPLLHPEFEKFCKYLSFKIPYKQLGLWTSLPTGYEHYREIICKTFYNIFINDHTIPNIYHCPVLVAIEEVIPDSNLMYSLIDHCWAQENWSASINPKGAFFCEIAASMSILFDGSNGWPVQLGWWWRTPKDFKEQIEEFCPRCGLAAPLPRRSSIEIVDDISPNNFELLKNKSYKIDRQEYIISDLKLSQKLEPLAAYKNMDYRSNIADKYGIFLVINDKYFITPYLKNNIDIIKNRKSIFYQYKEKFIKYIIEKYYNDIPTWTSQDELSWLNNQARNMESVADIGVWKGASTHALLSGCSGPVYAVDHFKGDPLEIDAAQQEALDGNIRDIFLSNCGHFDNLKLLEMDSLSAAKLFQPGSIDMIFIDAGHSLEDVTADINAWTPVARLLICGHDYDMDGVRTGVDGIFGDRVENPEGTIWSVKI